MFDILHRGHVTYLAQARALGASLVVALNTDASVRRLGKGDDRPINPLEDRAAVVAALQCVDLVTWFDADTPLEPILACRPDVLVKGGDWAVDKIVGAAEVLGWGEACIPFRSRLNVRPRAHSYVSAAADRPYRVDAPITTPTLDRSCSSRPDPASGRTCGRC